MAPLIGFDAKHFLSAMHQDKARAPGAWGFRSLVLAIESYFGAHLSLDRQAHEMDRALVRAVICWVMSLLFAVSFSDWSLAFDPRFSALLCCSLLYGAVSTWYYYSVRRKPDANVHLQYVFFLLDPLFAIWLISIDPPAFAWVAVILFAFITRVGVRYGMRVLMLSWCAAGVYFLLFFAFTKPASWLANREALYVIGASLFLAVPLFLPTIRRMAKSRDLEARRLKVDALAQRIEDRSYFLAWVSHELRTPLQAIVSAIDLIELRSGSPPDPALVAVVRRAADSLSAHLTDFLTLAKGEDGTLTVNPKRVDVLELFYSIAGSSRMVAKNKGLDLRLVTPESWPTVYIDGVRVAQVVENLLSNAIKYTEHGSITVTLKPYDSAEGVLRFSISDTGSGIGPAEIRSVFKPYVRAAATAARVEGSGIGLSVVSAVVAYLGGSVDVQSQVGHGSVFAVALPVVHAPRSGRSTLPSSRALIVAQDRIVVSELLALAEEARLTCDSADSVGQALNFLAAYRYEYIFIAPSMPTRSGVHLANEVLQGGTDNSGALLVAIDDSLEVRRANDAWPFAASLARPFSPKKLRALLASRTRPPAPNGSPMS